MAQHLSTTQQRAGAGEEWRTVAPAGLSVGLLLSGSLDFRLPDRGFQRFEGPLGFLFASRTPMPVDHLAAQDGLMTCVYLHLPVEAFERVLTQGDLLPGEAESFLDGGSDAGCRYWRSSAAAAAIGRDIEHCPFTGVARSFYLQGKAYEFLALAFDGLVDEEARSTPPAIGLTASDVERLHEARDILVSEFATPPSLDALAQRVGMSVTRLTAGFRRLFDDSVVGFLQRHRLQIAYDGLAAGRMTVAQAAYAAGYQPSSFSTLFQRRYGMPPSAIRRRHL